MNEDYVCNNGMIQMVVLCLREHRGGTVSSVGEEKQCTEIVLRAKYGLGALTVEGICVSGTDQSNGYCTPLEKFWQISLYVTEDAIAKLYVT